MRFDQSPPVAFHTLCGTARTLRRPRLIGQLDHATGRALTLVSAPPGTGKSTLVADWAATRPEIQFLSLALDERFNEPGLLTSVLHGGLRSLDVVRPQVGDFADSVLTLTDELALTPAPRRDVVIVIDDAQEMTARDIWADVNHLIGASPWWLHWVIVSRVDPTFGLRRFQLNGQLGQIRVSDLAFDADEAAALLTLLGLDLPMEAILRLTDWSEGWAAALCLAARAISIDDDERPWEHLASSETLVLDFLVEEVLDRLSSKDRTFLLRTSAADVVTADLAALLTGNVHAGSQLHRLERAGTFLLEVDQSGTQYRYHGLMATLLRARLHDESPDAAVELTRVAAHWYAAHGYPDEAERHAIRAKEWDLAALLRMRRCATQLMRTGSMFSAREVAFPRDAHRHPAVQLLAAIDAMNKHDRRTTELLLDKLDTSTTENDAGRAHDDEFILMQNLVEIERARWIAVGQRTDAAFATIRSIPSAGDELIGLSSYLLLREAELHLAACREDDAMRCFDELEASPEVPDWAADEAKCLLALVDAANGSPARTMALLDSARPPRSGDAATWLRCASSVVHGLRGNVAGLRQCTEVLAHTTAPRSSLFAQCLPVIRSAGLPSAGTASTLDTPPTGLPTSIAIALGILDGVDRQGRRWVIDGDLELTIVRARRAVDDASQRTLLELLLPWADVSMSSQHARTPIELYVLLAIAELRSDREEAALRRAEQAIELAGVAGIWGPLVTSETEFKQLLGRHSWELGARHPNALQVLDNIRAIHPARMEALTDRERVVLHYLPTLMSNTEIAAEMVVSVNTVKTHLKSIYRKLGVDRRRDALVRARQVELL